MCCTFACAVFMIWAGPLLQCYLMTADTIAYRSCYEAVCLDQFNLALENEIGRLFLFLGRLRHFVKQACKLELFKPSLVEKFDFRASLPLNRDRQPPLRLLENVDYRMADSPLYEAWAALRFLGEFLAPTQLHLAYRVSSCLVYLSLSCIGLCLFFARFFSRLLTSSGDPETLPGTERFEDPELQVEKGHILVNSLVVFCVCVCECVCGVCVCMCVCVCMYVCLCVLA